jgi:hypothetical protein
MVLNPALIRDPRDARLHMLFRATGKWAEPADPAQPAPYPIFLGYMYSDDDGTTWTADLSRPALAPALEMQAENIRVKTAGGQISVDYANGCIEDPRLFWLEGVCHMIAACRMFPPGPYWIHDDPLQCAPDWVHQPDAPGGRAATENVTVNVLFRVDLDALRAGRYDEAFAFVTHLTDPEHGENRDVLLFPRKLRIGGREQFVCIHRPQEPARYPGGNDTMRPSIWICAAESLVDISTAPTAQACLATPRFDWELNRIGASAPLLDLGSGEWLLSYHGKRDAVMGYTQSFMILREQPDSLPIVVHRCPERLFVPEEDWEQPERFETPCVFTTGLEEAGDDLLVAYGAADQQVGIARFDRKELLRRIRLYDAEGKAL